MHTVNSSATTTNLWKALADPRRRRLVEILQARPHTTSELCDYFHDVSRFAVMKHLRVLAEAGLTVTQRSGRQRWHMLVPEELPQLSLAESSLPESQSASPAQTKTAVSQTNHPSLPTTPAPLRPSEIAPSWAATPLWQWQQQFPLPAATIYHALTAELDAWWPWRLSPSSQLSLELYAGGRLREQAGTQERLHAHLLYLDPHRELHFSGRWGQPLAPSSCVQWLLQEQAAPEGLMGWHTAVQLTYYSYQFYTPEDQPSHHVPAAYQQAWHRLFHEHLPAHLLLSA